jgi:uncharacterized delta-60 repeat protein
MNTPLFRRRLVFVATITITMSWWASARATPGDLDATFGGGGIVTTRVTPRETSGANAVAIQADGKIVAAGGTQGSDGERFAIVRYDVDGHLDATFGHDGRVRSSFAARRCVVADAVAIQPDGKIVAAGIQGCRGSFALARYLPNGRLDPSFGGDGKVVTRFRSGKRYSESFSVVIQPDGRIVAAGLCCGSRFALSRYLPNGRLDASFGADGKVTTDFTPAPDVAYDLAIQGDGKILAAGVAAKDGDAARFALVRYRPNGHLDPTFGHDGKVTTRPSDCVAEAHAVSVQTDGKIVAAGSAGCIDEFALTRYLTDGSLDDTFGDGGITISDFTVFGCAQADLNAMALQSDGKLVASGFTACKGTNDVEFAFASARYNDDGTLDPSFGQGGEVMTVVWDAACFQGATGVAIQADEKIVVAGGTVCSGPRHTKFTLARYTNE